MLKLTIRPHVMKVSQQAQPGYPVTCAYFLLPPRLQPQARAFAASEMGKNCLSLADIPAALRTYRLTLTAASASAPLLFGATLIARVPRIGGKVSVFHGEYASEGLSFTARLHSGGKPIILFPAAPLPTLALGDKREFLPWDGAGTVTDSPCWIMEWDFPTLSKLLFIAGVLGESLAWGDKGRGKPFVRTEGGQIFLGRYTLCQHDGGWRWGLNPVSPNEIEFCSTLFKPEQA